jgi:hypothetical protein
VRHSPNFLGASRVHRAGPPDRNHERRPGRESTVTCWLSWKGPSPGVAMASNRWSRCLSRCAKTEHLCPNAFRRGAKLAVRPRKRTSPFAGISVLLRIPSPPSEDAGDRTGDDRPLGVGPPAERLRESRTWVYLGRGPHRRRKACTGTGLRAGVDRKDTIYGFRPARWAGSRKGTRIENTPRGLRLPRGFSRVRHPGIRLVAPERGNNVIWSARSALAGNA